MLRDPDEIKPIKNDRSSANELEKIKKHSDENLQIIFQRITTENDEEKRNIVVNLIGALDYYIHEIVIWGLIQITFNKFPKGKNYKNYKIELEYEYLKLAFENEDIFNDTELKKKIIQNIRKNTYQKWEDIKKALYIILPSKICEQIASLTDGKKKKALFQTNELNELANKRHLIVHHFDREYLKSSLRNAVNVDCKESYDLIEKIINSIHEIIENYDNEQPENS